MNICANTDLLVGALFKKKVVSQRNAREIANSMCCDGDIVSVNCLQRKCEKCAEKQIVYINEFDGDEMIKYEQWGMNKETYKDRSGQMKTVIVTSKLSKREKTILMWYKSYKMLNSLNL